MTHNGVKITEEALKEGFLLEKGETLEFVITKQIIQQRTVPELICLKLATARFMLESSQLNFDAYEDASVIDLEEAFIYKQTPDPGTSVKSGDYVKLFLTLEQPLACDEDDELPGIDPSEDN
jgi:beta-lactam-binding protein with PASTA domain